MWLVQTRQKRDLSGWTLIAESDEGGGFWPCCQCEHPTADEAQACELAKIRAGEVTGFPHLMETVSRD